jgi:hypothetical protein
MKDLSDAPNPEQYATTPATWILLFQLNDRDKTIVSTLAQLSQLDGKGEQNQ